MRFKIVKNFSILQNFLLYLIINQIINMKQTENRKISHFYDLGYKRIFSKPKVMIEFIKHFVDENIGNQISECELIDKDFITKRYKTFSSDLVYKVKISEKNRELLLLILFEFKRKQDKYEPLNILNYECLLYKKLLREKKISSPLPPILPIVIYNGKTAYTAPTNFYELVDSSLEAIKKYIPNFCYICIDINKLSKENLIKLIIHTRNISALLFRFDLVNEKKLSDEIKELFTIIQGLFTNEELEDIADYITAQLLAKGVEFDDDFPTLIKEEPNMLAEKIQKALIIEHNKGKKEGKLEGRIEGKLEGLREGKMEANINALVKAFELTKDLKISAEIVGFDIFYAEKILKEKGLL